MSKRGFLLFELMVVLVLLTLILLCGFFYHTTLDHSMVRTELDTLYMTFMNLAYKAYWQKKDIYMYFDCKNNAYSYENITHPLDSVVCFGIQENLKGPPSSPTIPLSHPITFSNNHVAFYADGTIQAGTVYITNKKRTITYALSAPIAHISYVRRYWNAGNRWVLLT